LTLLKADIPEAGYGKKIVLRNVALSIEEGEIVSLIGPNGAGKSTLLKVLTGILKIPQGSIQLNGTMITNRNPDLLVKSSMSFIPQGNRVFTELTVAENLELGGYILNCKDEVVRRVEQILETFPDLKEKLKQNAGKLSGGEKQQLALARALVLQPTLLLMDEPSLGLSPKLVAKAFDTIKKINTEFKTTIILVEQKVHEVLKIANRIYALRMGEVVFSGTPSELQSGDVMKRIFLV
jgi:ABC-type branched-subunit amino acid transport system ATPase component